MVFDGCLDVADEFVDIGGGGVVGVDDEAAVLLAHLQVSEKHCGFIVNADHATAADVDELIRHIQATVKDQFNVDLEPEVHRVGEFL